MEQAQRVRDKLKHLQESDPEIIVLSMKKVDKHNIDSAKAHRTISFLAGHFFADELQFLLDNIDARDMFGLRINISTDILGEVLQRALNLRKLYDA